MEFQVIYLVIFLLFSVTDSFEWFYMEKFFTRMSSQCWSSSRLLHFPYYILMTFLMILSVILRSMLMILLSIPSVIQHLICSNNLNWLLNLNLIYEKLFSARKTQLVSIDQSNNNSSIDVKMDGSVLEENSSFKMLGSFSSQLDWGSYIISIAKTAS